MKLRGILQTTSMVDYSRKPLHENKENDVGSTLITSCSSTSAFRSDIIFKTDKCILNEECIHLSKINDANSFMLLILSEWFVFHLFHLLKLDEIKIIDSVICNHQSRYIWLERIKKIELNINLDHTKYDHNNYQSLLNWIIMKSFKVHKLEMNLAHDGRQGLIPETFIKCVTQNSPNMKKIILRNGELSDVSLEDISNNCPNLECLLFEEMNENSSSMLSIKCHQLKFFEIANVLYCASDSDSDITNTTDTTNESFKQILTNNSKLETFRASNVITDCDIFEILGKYNPCLRSIEIWLNYGEDIFPSKVLDEHIDIFTQGCRHLKSFSTNMHRFSYSKLFHCFGTNNPYLEKIEIDTNDVWDDDNERTQRVEHISACLLEGLCKGCPLLKEFSCSDLGLSTQGLSSFTIFCPYIEMISLERCAILDDGCKLLEGKVSNLKSLYLGSMINLTDDGIVNIVKTCGCNLKVIRMEFCSQLSDICLKHIAKHCPNLVRIVVMEESFRSFTVEVIWELFNSCKKLTDIRFIVSDAYFYPEGLAEALKQRIFHFRNILLLKNSFK